MFENMSMESWLWTFPENNESLTHIDKETALQESFTVSVPTVQTYTVQF